jgi:hypothetical protein
MMLFYASLGACWITLCLVLGIVSSTKPCSRLEIKGRLATIELAAMLRSTETFLCIENLTSIIEKMG